jgi:hypothetical protein
VGTGGLPLPAGTRAAVGSPGAREGVSHAKSFSRNKFDGGRRGGGGGEVAGAISHEG